MANIRKVFNEEAVAQRYAESGFTFAEVGREFGISGVHANRLYQKFRELYPDRLTSKPFAKLTPKLPEIKSPTELCQGCRSRDQCVKLCPDAEHYVNQDYKARQHKTGIAEKTLDLYGWKSVSAASIAICLKDKSIAGVIYEEITRRQRHSPLRRKGYGPDHDEPQGNDVFDPPGNPFGIGRELTGDLKFRSAGSTEIDPFTIIQRTKQELWEESNRNLITERRRKALLETIRRPSNSKPFSGRAWKGERPLCRICKTVFWADEANPDYDAYRKNGHCPFCHQWKAIKTRVRTHKPKDGEVISYGEGRICKRCGATLSIYNSTESCWSHSAFNNRY